MIVSAVRVSMTASEFVATVAGALAVGALIGLVLAWRNRDQ
jgi:hypothetical protein